MNKETLGVIETVGMAAAIEAADTCVKSADVELIGYELTKGSGLVTVKIRGNVGAVKAAIDAAKVSASKVNQVYATLIIPRPAEGIEKIIESDSTVGIETYKAEPEHSAQEVCNICHDPGCTRKKGQSRTLCMSYKGLEGDKNVRGK